VKPGTIVQVSYDGKRGIVLGTKGDTIIVKVGDKIMYYKKTDINGEVK